MQEPQIIWSISNISLYHRVSHFGLKVMILFLIIALLPMSFHPAYAVSESPSGSPIQHDKSGVLDPKTITQSDSPIYIPIVFNSNYDPGEGAGDGWPMAGANPQRTSWTSMEVKGNLKAEWFTHFDAYISQKVQIIATNGLLYISASDGLHALDANTGRQVWFYPTSMPLGNSPTYFDGVVYVGGYDRQIHAIDAGDGSALWQYTASAGFETNPVVANGILYAGNRDGYMYAIYTQGANIGKLAWKYKTDGPILFSAAYRNNAIYFASSDMYAYALRADNGNLVWKSSKLPGNILHSWWPVIYREYVVFVGSYNYRYPGPYGNQPHQVMDQSAYPAGSSQGDPVGTVGTEAGDWVAGTTTINASSISQYLETYPHRRTVVILDQSSGNEFTYDSDGDGRPEYAPFLFFGTHSGTRYPPAVGADNVLYLSNDYVYDPAIPRGHVSGWKFGTSTISIPSSSTNAVDEPMGYAIGGSSVYWKRCCDRKAGAFALDGSYSASYYDEGGIRLRRTLPDLFAEGWDFSAWKHGDATPPIPYNNRVYTINNNAVVAFSTSGKDPILPLNESTGSDTGIPADSIERATTVTGLNTKVTYNNTSWPLLMQQERYYEIREDPTTRGRYMRFFEVAGSTASGTSSTSSSSTNTTTTITSNFSGGTLTTRVSNRTPTILFNNTGSQYILTGEFTGIAYPTSGGVEVRTGSASISGSSLSEGWLLVWDDTASHRWAPVVITLQKRPGTITMSSSSLSFNANGYMAVTPLYGMSEAKSSEETSWPGGIPQATIERIRLLHRAAHAFPASSTDNYSIDSASRDVTLTYTYSYTSFSDDWGTSALTLAYLPPHLALAAWNGSPIRVNNQTYESAVTDFNYLTPIGRFGGAAGNPVSVRLPGLGDYWRDIPANPSVPASGDTLQASLIQEVQKIVSAGHLLPGYGMYGIWDAKASNRLGQSLADYWHNPAELYYTLIRALPLLPADLQTQVRQYVQTEFQSYPTYNITHIGWQPGTLRDAFSLPPEVEAARASESASGNTSLPWGFSQENIYASWLYAREFGNASTLFTNSTARLNSSEDILFPQSMPHVLNAQISGYIGYLHLAQLANQGVQTTHERTLTDLLILRAALTKYPNALEQTGFEYGGYQWSVRTYSPNMPETLFVVRTAGTLWSQMPLYGFQKDLIYGLSGGGTGGGYSFGLDYVNLVPELADFMYDYAGTEVAQSVADYQQRTPYWFVANSEEGAGEGVVRPIYDVVALFQAKAMILNQSRSELQKYLDVPATPVGDLYYIQNLISTLSAGY